MAERKLISADAMAYAVEHDPQFRLPERPRFLAELLTVPLPDGLLIEGAAERQVFRGQAATTLLPQLLPLLDGTRTMDELTAALPEVPVKAVTNAVALLYTRGVLEDGSAGTDVDLDTVPPQFLAFLRRHVDMTRVNRSAAEAIRRLRVTRLAIVANPEDGALLAAELRQMEFTQVQLWENGLQSLGDVDLVIGLAAGAEDADLFSRLDEACRKQGIPWLRALFTGSGAELGPYFDTSYNPCYRCFRALHTADVHMDHQTEARRRLWLSVTATEVCNLISRVCPPNTIQETVGFQFDDWSQTRVHPVKVPGCATCCPGSTSLESGLHPAYAYEQMVAFPPKHLISPKDHQHHYRVANLELQVRQKRYPSARQIPLPAVTDAPVPTADHLVGLFEAASASAQGLDKATLAGLLIRGVGLRRSAEGATVGKVDRWAPTGGNLGSVQCYVIARRVKDLQPGCYFYQVNDHSLAELPPRRTGEELTRLAEAAAGAALDRDPTAVLVLTGAHERVSSKYGAFAYRLLYLDAGVATAQLHAVAAGHGLRLQAADRWNDALLLEELALDGDTEPITRVLALYDGRDADGNPVGFHEHGDGTIG